MSARAHRQATRELEPPISAETEAKNAEREGGARAIVRRNVYWAVSAGLVPIPLVDFVAVTAVQVKLLKQLSDHYAVEFSEQKAQKLVGSLIGGTGSVAVGRLVAHSLFKLIPGLGTIAGFVSVPILSGALTLAIGNLFIMHYESGGTLLDFDGAKMRSHFQQEFAQAQESVKKIQAEKKPTRSAP